MFRSWLVPFVLIMMVMTAGGLSAQRVRAVRSSDPFPIPRSSITGHTYAPGATYELTIATKGDEVPWASPDFWSAYELRGDGTFDVNVWTIRSSARGPVLCIVDTIAVPATANESRTLTIKTNKLTLGDSMWLEGRWFYTTVLRENGAIVLGTATDPHKALDDPSVAYSMFAGYSCD